MCTICNLSKTDVFLVFSMSAFFNPFKGLTIGRPVQGADACNMANEPAVAAISFTRNGMSRIISRHMLGFLYVFLGRQAIDIVTAKRY